ncbi:VOC family protein [Anaerocolumna sp. MB42-C2]|uniref:VOC family protein n=1 Tax=Anaerocolumna sp. MB42-C2 TaxID=3070997 RepID=UPI0027E1B9E2|nr:VOC family protein [Anaerocolumna sp. MB42-C2]WMJ87122.1 VOC family protein [Anaerocolumna sp. MB42-C2]
MKTYDNFFVPVNNLVQAKDFYQKVLGLSLKFDFSEKGMVAVQVGNEEPAIILKDTHHFPDAKPAIWFEVDCVEDKYQSLKEKGVTFLGEPYKIGTGHAVEFEDIFGNRLGITDYLL